ncbi:MAG TPA: LacI family DNA-binding transcriptional regulator [Lachnospiraceae bacterium]|nr:LacI family DNA-binding transcriptional regulator [Lachnospiraceae bacterium]
MVSIKDVAKQAGVAISTVSKVLNGYPNISDETKKKVNIAIAELNFVPNTIAAALSSKQSGRVAILINLITQTQAIDEIDMQYLSGAMNQARKNNLDVITIFFTMIKDKTVDEIIRYLKSQNIAGIIIYGLSKDDEVLQKLIETEKFKIVVVDSPMVNKSTSSVWIDQGKAQYDVAKKTIIENKCKKVLYISGKKNGYVTAERIKGMEKLVKELTLTMTVKHGEFSELTARNLTFKYAKKHDVVVCASDLMAIGAMNALTQMDIFKPVCGFDGITLMGYVGKQMNTVKQNFAKISEEAMIELNSLMNGSNGKNIILDYELVRLGYLDIIC